MHNVTRTAPQPSTFPLIYSSIFTDTTLLDCSARLSSGMWPPTLIVAVPRARSQVLHQAGLARRRAPTMQLPPAAWLDVPAVQWVDEWLKDL